jgi:CDP-diacylglycerol--serine O-phosphatidyltransferase
MTAFNKSLESNPKKPTRLHRLKHVRLKQGLHVLPNLCTLTNALCGFASIIFSARGDFLIASYCILLGAVMDCLDGRIARLAQATSQLGMQLDSLCDGISFVLAPAILMYAWHLKYIGPAGLIACALFLMTGLFRLARFNIISSQQSTHFRGLPTTIAGCFLASLYLNTHHAIYSTFHGWLLTALITILALLMPSNVPFFAFKHISKKSLLLSSVGLILFLTSLGFTRFLLLFFIGYFVISLSIAGYHRLQNFNLLKNS